MGNKPSKKGKGDDTAATNAEPEDPWILSPSDRQIALKIYKDPRFVDTDGTVQFYDRHSQKHGLTLLVVGERHCGARSVFRMLTGSVKGSKFTEMGTDFSKDERSFQNGHFDKKPFDFNVWKTEEPVSSLEVPPNEKETAEELLISRLPNSNILVKLNRNKEWRFRGEKDAGDSELACIFVFDLTKPESLTALQTYFVALYWFYMKLESKNKLNKAGKMLFRPVVLLVGVKSDQTAQRKISKEDLEKFTAPYNVPFMEVNAIDSHGMGETRDAVLASVAKEWWAAMDRLFGPTPAGQ